MPNLSDWIVDLDRMVAVHASGLVMGFTRPSDPVWELQPGQFPRVTHSVIVQPVGPIPRGMTTEDAGRLALGAGKALVAALEAKFTN